MFSIHQQTIRLYEKEGLINPKRSEGNTRLFSEEDIQRLEEVIHLTHQLGINLAGVQMILKLKKQLTRMQKDMNKMFEQTQEQLDQETEISKQSVKASAKQLMTLKQQAAVPHVETNKPRRNNPLETMDLENWEIEYDQD